MAVAVDIDRQVAEIVDVLAVPPDVANPVFRPRRRLVPAVARHDVEPVVVIQIGEGGRLARARIDHVDREPDIGRAPLRVQCAESDNDGAQHAQ